jgi:hypothetical protein
MVAELRPLHAGKWSLVRAINGKWKGENSLTPNAVSGSSRLMAAAHRFLCTSQIATTAWKNSPKVNMFTMKCA